MKEISVPVEKFDLDGFIGKVLTFLKNQILEGIDPSCAIYWVESPGRTLHDEGDDGWDFRSKLLNGGALLFFPFSFPDLAGSFVCADGHSYRITEDQADDDECFIQEDVFGYLVHVNDETIGIASGICPLSGCNLPPTIDLVLDCKELEQPMIDFIGGFMK